MFARIAGRYDFLNHFLSVGIDRLWRKWTVRKARELSGALEGRTVVDACCGTGDLSLAFAAEGAEVIGVDFTYEMLTFATKKEVRAGRVAFAHGDALRLPVEDARADLSSVAFGIRNVADRVLGFREMKRVLRPGGWALVLEFTNPTGPVMSRLYRFYFTRVLPVIGKLVSKDDAAYRYLPDTVLAWPHPEQLQAEMEEVGFERCGFVTWTFGIACLHWGRVPREEEPA